LWIAWAPETTQGDPRAATVAAARETRLLELQEDRDLQRAAESQLANVRRAAESWRTGLAALLAVLTAVFFVKGKDSFDDIEPGRWRYGLAASLVIAALFAVYGAYRALRAAYGAPRDEYVGRASFPIGWMPRFLRTTPGEIDEYGTLSAWRHAFAVQAVRDLFHAKVSTVASLLAIVVAAVITWWAPGPPPPAYTEVTYAVGDVQRSVCGTLRSGSAGHATIVDAENTAHDFAFRELRSLRVVDACD
jgi:hypothetical protein